MSKVHFVGAGSTAASGPTFEIEPERVLANDVILEDEYNPHNVTLWVMGHEFGAVAVVWASDVSDAMDIAADAGLLGAFSIDEDDQAELDEDEEGIEHLGNYGEPYRLTEYFWIDRLRVHDQPLKTLLRFAEARGAGSTTLDDDNYDEPD